MKNQMKCCELCNQQASSYCPSDSAFLCFNCDDVVHGANFLVARHHRNLLCCNCDCFTGTQISGATSCRRRSTCRSCSPESFSNDADSLPSSSSESRATTPKKIKAGHSLSSVTDDASPAAAVKKMRRSVGSVAEEVFVKWSRELELEVNDNHVALKALGVCLRRWKLLPFRVAAATSFWLGLRLCGDGCIATSQNLLKLEAISRVPAKLILAAHAKLTRVFTNSLQLEEAWDES